MISVAQLASYTRYPLFLGLTAFCLSGCSGSDSSDSNESFNARDRAATILEAGTGPLEDLNLRRKEIPPLLQKAALHPYLAPVKTDCTTIQAELAELDLLLGPDYAPKEVEVAMNDSANPLAEVQQLDMNDVELPETHTVFYKGVSFAQDAVVSLVRSKTNILPFRSIIRRVTGAARHEKRVQEAYEAGKLRRAYLKGLVETRFGKRCLTTPPPKPVSL